MRVIHSSSASPDLPSKASPLSSLTCSAPLARPPNDDDDADAASAVRMLVCCASTAINWSLVVVGDGAADRAGDAAGEAAGPPSGPVPSAPGPPS
jgi:hypothetical protein